MLLRGGVSFRPSDPNPGRRFQRRFLTGCQNKSRDKGILYENGMELPSRGGGEVKGPSESLGIPPTGCARRVGSGAGGGPLLRELPGGPRRRRLTRPHRATRPGSGRLRRTGLPTRVDSKSVPSQVDSRTVCAEIFSRLMEGVCGGFRFRPTDSRSSLLRPTPTLPPHRRCLRVAPAAAPLPPGRPLHRRPCPSPDRIPPARPPPQPQINWQEAVLAFRIFCY